MPWLCAQIGAREHYAVPRALHESGRLTVLYTDFWAGPLWRRMGRSKLGALRSLATRYHAELAEKSEIKKAESRNQTGERLRHLTPALSPIEAEREKRVKIISWNGRALWWEILRKAESRKRETGSGRGKAETLKTETLKEEATKAESEKQKAEDGGSKMKGGAADNEFQLSAFPPTPHPGPLPDRGGEGDEKQAKQSGKQKVENINEFQFSAFSVSDFKHSGPYPGFIEVGRRFAIRVREDLKRRTDMSANVIFYAYDTGALEAFEWCHGHGVKCVLNQMDPNRVEVDLVRAEEKQWPGWALESIEVPEAYFVRREQEWALADRVVVNSEFSRQALLQQGVPAEKLVVIPLCFEIKVESSKVKVETGLSRHLSPSEAEREKEAESGKQETGNTNKAPDASQLFQLSESQLSAFLPIPDPDPLPERGGEGIGTEDDGLKIEDGADGNEFQLSAFSVPAFFSTSPLRVLFLGQVILRKGIQYLIAAAKLLEWENVQFDIVGSLGISAAAIATAPKNMRFHGRTNRDQAAAWYRQSHLFVLPTLSDGFAITQLEAMAHGLPVVTTPCCGEVVSDGVDGFVVSARDVGALAKVFRRYLTEPELLPNQSAALVKARQFTQERLAENLGQLEDSLKKS